MGFSEVSQVWFPSSRAYDGDSCWRGFIEVCSQRNLQEVMGQEREGTCRKWRGRRGKKLQSKHVILAGFWPQLYPTEDSGAWTAPQSKSKSSLETRGPSRCSPLLFINFIRGCVASQVRAQPSLPATGREHSCPRGHLGRTPAAAPTEGFCWPFKITW